MVVMSSIPEYIDYGNYIARECYTRAIDALNCILNGSYDLDNDQKSYVLSRIGRTYFLIGNHEEALKNYINSEAASPYSYEAKYQFARFLILDLKNVNNGINKCEKCIEDLKRSPFAESEEDVSSQAYIERFRALIPDPSRGGQLSSQPPSD